MTAMTMAPIVQAPPWKRAILRRAAADSTPPGWMDCPELTTPTPDGTIERALAAITGALATLSRAHDVS
jgi:hypothetical protein